METLFQKIFCADSQQTVTAFTPVVAQQSACARKKSSYTGSVVSHTDTTLSSG
ncbi:TPA: hypothetical protein ACIPUI_003230 [Citrobacter freundii]